MNGRVQLRKQHREVWILFFCCRLSITCRGGVGEGLGHTTKALCFRREGLGARRPLFFYSWTLLPDFNSFNYFPNIFIVFGPMTTFKLWLFHILIGYNFLTRSFLCLFSPCPAQICQEEEELFHSLTGYDFLSFFIHLARFFVWNVSWNCI